MKDETKELEETLNQIACLLETAGLQQTDAGLDDEQAITDGICEAIMGVQDALGAL